MTTWPRSRVEGAADALFSWPILHSGSEVLCGGSFGELFDGFPWRVGNRPPGPGGTRNALVLRTVITGH
jgi:hypothetical protein